MNDLDIIEKQIHELIAEVATEDHKYLAPTCAAMVLEVWYTSKYAEMRSPRSTSDLLKTIDAIGNDLCKLAQKFAGIQAPLVRALHFQPGLSSPQIGDNLLQIAIALDGARKLLLDQSGDRGAGRPRKKESLQVSAVVAVSYYLLTGRRPSAGRDRITGHLHPFVDFLNIVLNVLELKDPQVSAVYMARQAIPHALKVIEKANERPEGHLRTQDENGQN